MGGAPTLEFSLMLELKNVGLSLGNIVLVSPFSLTVAAGEIVTVMGPSGSGKSSLLSCIGGDLSDAIHASGDVLLNGQSLLAIAPAQRRVGRLFQDDLLFPHMTVGENLLFAVPAMARTERLMMVSKVLERAELQGFAHRPPHTLSGGQRQRVALMRALLAKPLAILLDEPFNKLDRTLREQMRDYVFGHIYARRIPALLVTHDPADVPQGGRVLKISSDGEVRNV
jgi:putative thiamine transport system ATP-binding protein